MMASIGDRRTHSTWSISTTCMIVLWLVSSTPNVSSYRKGEYHSRMSMPPCKTIVVDPKGQGNFTSIQSAIDFVPQNNNAWICIRIREGIYREKLTIPYEKPYIVMKGKGKRKTEVVWDDHATIIQSPTFTSLADNVVVRSMSFRNSYNNPINRNPTRAAVAAMISGDKSYFYKVGFFGLQDTLWDDQGRHYFKRCTIQGAVDFIFGSGQSIYEGCSISIIGNGYITAQGRCNTNDANGFVFRNCNVLGNGKGITFLGRPWRAYARVLFYNCNFSDVINPVGWDPWGYGGSQAYQLTFAEVNCYGPGANTSLRPSWTNKVNSDSNIVMKLTSMSFIDSQDWLNTIPF